MNNMFRIIGIETIDPGDTLLAFLNNMPNLDDNTSNWMVRFKEDRYDSVVRTLKNDDVRRTYVLHHEYIIHEHKAIRVYQPALHGDFYEKGQAQVSVSAIVGKNGSGKSTLLDLMVRLMNNTAYALKQGIDNNESYDLHFAECVYARLFIENHDGTVIVIEQQDHNIMMYHQEGGQIIWRYNNIDDELRWVENPDLENISHCQTVLGSLFYTVVVNYSAYAFNINDYRSEWIDCDEQYIVDQYRGDNQDAYEGVRLAVNNGNGFVSDEERCWIGSLFHKNDAYQTPIVLNPYRVRGNVDYNKEKALLNERLFLLLLDNREMIGAILGGKVPYSYIFRQEEEYLPKAGVREVFFSKKVYDALNVINAFELLDEQEIIAKAGRIANIILDCWEKCLGFKLVRDRALMHRGEDNDGICALNYIVYKTVKSTDSYSKYRGMKESLRNEQNIDRLVMTLYCDTTHITLKLRRALTYLIFRHYGTERVIEGNRRSNETLLDDFARTVNQNVATQQAQVDELKEQRPVENPYIAEQFRAMELTPRGPWTREELLPTPSMDVTLRLDLGDGEYTGFNLLSSGEKQMIYTLGTTIYQLHHLNSAGAGAIRYHSANLVFDEIDLYFHPEYQKGLVKRIVEMIGKMELNNIEHVNIIFATHSPFILSDIHKRNILYMKDGIEASDEVNTNPLGANINDILCQSFFLSDGFMGDYIKEKLLDFISYLHGDERQPGCYPWNEREETFIEAVGDPFLKTKLYELYRDKQVREEQQ